MPKLSPREAARAFHVSRATLAKALEAGVLSAEKTAAGHWQIDPAELARLYRPRAPQKPSGRPGADHVGRDEPVQAAGPDATALAVRLARAEAALEAEREKTALLERHVADLRRLLPPAAPRPGRRWWPW